MEEFSAVEKWVGGELRVFTPFGPTFARVIDEASDTPQQLVQVYRPLGNAWAIRADMPPVVLPELGLELDFDVRAGRLECVGIRSIEGGPALTATLLRQAGSSIAGIARKYWSLYVVRLRELDGEVIAVLPYGEDSAVGTQGELDVIGSDVEQEYTTRRQRTRQPIDDALLDRIDALWKEAEDRGERSKARYVGNVLGYSPGTIRNYRSSRDRPKASGLKGDKNGE